MILGWNETIYSILDLLQSEDEGSSGAVVILSATGKDTMEQQIAKNCRSRRAQRTICRTGAIDSVQDLLRINLPAARHVIVVGEPAAEDSAVDGSVLRAALACSQAVATTAVPDAFKTKPRVLIGHRLLHTGRLVNRLSAQWKMDITTVRTLNVLVKIIAQCAWQSGLAAVYRDLLTYSGETAGSAAGPGAGQPSNEIYCISAKAAGIPAGTSFEQAFWGLDRGILAGCFKNGELLVDPVGPERQHPLAPDDMLVVVAPARQGVRYHPAAPPTALPARAEFAAPSPRAIWLVGTGVEARAELADLVHYLPPGSKIAAAETLENPPDRQVEVTQVNSGSLELLGEETLRELVRGYDTVVISSDDTVREQHDTSMLAQMSAIRSVCGDDVQQPVIVAELLDQRNSQLAANMDVRDILVTPELASNYMVQLVRDPLRAAVYSELLGPENAEMYIRPADLYLPAGRDQVSWTELMAAAWDRGEILLGYFQTPSTSLKGDGLVLNPRRRDQLRPAGHYHRMVVLARD